MSSPQLYATMLLWLLSELFEQLPEVGDPDKPKLVFFFDEAHLLFTDAPKPLLDKIQQVVRLVRSKGVGVYFVTQNPLDVPDNVLGQLGNRVQHALRAFTPRDQKAVKAAAETFRPNPKLNTEKVITELGVGEGLISLLDEQGTPAPVERGFVVPPASRVGPITSQERDRTIKASVIYGHYEKVVDRESAYERLKGKAAAAPPAEEAPVDRQYHPIPATTAHESAPPEEPESYREPAPPVRRQPAAPPPTPAQSSGGSWTDALGGVLGGLGGIGSGGGRRQGLGEAMAKSAARAVGSQIGRQIVRGVLGGILGGGTSRSRY